MEGTSEPVWIEPPTKIIVTNNPFFSIDRNKPRKKPKKVIRQKRSKRSLLTDKHRDFINSKKNKSKKVGRLKRFTRAKMKRFLLENFYPLDKTADRIINDFELLCSYISFEKQWSNPPNLNLELQHDVSYADVQLSSYKERPALDILFGSLIEKYGEHEIKEAIKRSGL